MTVIESVHADHGATFGERGGRTVVEHYGRPERVHKAVRNLAGVCEMVYGVVTVTGDDRVEFVDNAVSNRVPAEDGEGVYALLLDPQGKVRLDMYVYNAGERLLLFVPPGTASELVEDWSEKVFIQDVELTVATDDFATFGVHGPKATEKVASVLNKSATPDGHLTFVRGTMGDEGVTVIRGDGLIGDEGYEVVCAADDAEAVFSTLVNHGLNAAPFGYRTWDALTLEGGTPLFDTELEGRLPNVLGLRNALDFEKGCYVGQEVVSRVENRGQPSRRLVGLEPEAVPEPGAAVFDGDEAVGEVTRAGESPSLDRPLAFALLPFDSEATDLAVRVDGDEVAATRTELPFLAESDRSARVPEYPS
ncbi:CAF17-like 4Fe-4S cluster assembly/insertion protein YgfZ [Haloarchaeobius amylolyticus]|uniref:CAF17-like 4Fe-4S cluster assembly/insertion protein YgfZ n=1 Tax=Haloarchaeobius amylolyticus TaxID=1198296 RepID=UPI00226E9949|nr:aminomethyltransferase family protein [Haloarchaeobius amylolyticus]